MTYKFSRFENETINKYEFDTYENALSWINGLIDEFKKINRVKDEAKDRYFIRFKSELMDSLNMQKVNKGQVLDDYYKCKSCLEKDHEGIFCRCEDRNIRV